MSYIEDPNFGIHQIKSFMDGSQLLLLITIPLMVQSEWYSFCPRSIAWVVVRNEVNPKVSFKLQHESHSYPFHLSGYNIFYSINSSWVFFHDIITLTSISSNHTSKWNCISQRYCNKYIWRRGRVSQRWCFLPSIYAQWVCIRWGTYRSTQI